MFNTDEHYSVLIKLLSESLEKSANALLKRSGLTHSQITVLVFLDSRDPSEATMRELQETLMRAQPTVVGIVSRMEHKNLLERCSTPEDKRIKKIRMTDKGRRVLKAAMDSLTRLEKDFISCLTEEEQKVFLNTVKKLIACQS